MSLASPMASEGKQTWTPAFAGVTRFREGLLSKFTRWIRRAVLVALALALAPAHAADRAFTIAVIPDTQNYIDYTHQTAEGYRIDASAMFLEQMAYVAANVESAGGEIAFVTSLGDVWQHQTMDMDPGHRARGFKRVDNPHLDTHFAPTTKVFSIEMPMAVKGYEMIAGKVPFSVVPGNHDHDAMWTDAGHPPAETFTDLASLGKLHAGGTANFVTVFGAESPFFKGKDWYVDSSAGGANSAQIFSAGGYRFLHIGLQFDPPNDALKWAATVIEHFPGLPTIVSTHAYLNTDAEREANPLIDNAAIDPEDNNPRMVWDKFLSRHDQIFMVLCGHHHGQAFRVDDNRAGHKVWQLLSDYQDRNQVLKDLGVEPGRADGIGDGWLRLMRFDMAGIVPRVTIETYSTHYRKQSRDTPEYAAWYREHEQPRMNDAQFRAADDFSFELTDFVDRFGKPGSK